MHINGLKLLEFSILTTKSEDFIPGAQVCFGLYLTPIMQFHDKTYIRIQLCYVFNVVQICLKVFHSILRNKTWKKQKIYINIGHGAQVCFGLFLQDVTQCFD